MFWKLIAVFLKRTLADYTQNGAMGPFRLCTYSEFIWPNSREVASNCTLFEWIKIIWILLQKEWKKTDLEKNKSFHIFFKTIFPGKSEKVRIMNAEGSPDIVSSFCSFGKNYYKISKSEMVFVYQSLDCTEKISSSEILCKTQ